MRAPRWLIAAVAVIATLGASAPQATAGLYEVAECHVAGGNDLNPYIHDASSIKGNIGRYARSSLNCGSDPKWLQVRSTGTANGNMIGYTELVAEGSQIVNAKVGTNFQRAGNQRPRLFATDLDGSNLINIQAGTTQGWVGHDVALDRPRLVLALDCVASGNCPYPNDAVARMRNLRLTLSDTTAPAVLLTEDALEGDTLTVHGWDVGSGIERFTVSVNGVQVDQTVYPCSPTAEPATRTRLRACAPGPPATGDPDSEPRTETFTLDTDAPPFVAGKNTIEVCARDLATLGSSQPNETCESLYTPEIGDHLANVRLRGPLAAQGRYFGYNGTIGTGFPQVTTLDVAGGVAGEEPKWATANIMRSAVAGWFSVQPNEGGTFQWGNVDAYYNLSLARNLTPIIQMYGPPAWARDSTCTDPCVAPVKSTKLGAWANYVSALATRYPQAILEVWNEPNFSSFWRQDGLADMSEWEAEPERYAELARIAAEAVHAVNPEQLVIGGSLTTPLNDGWNNEQGRAYAEPGAYLRDALAAEPRLADPDDPAGLDGLSFHPYPAGLDRGYFQNSLVPYTRNVYMNKVFGRIRAALANADAAHLGLWITEFGIPRGQEGFLPDVPSNPLAGQSGALTSGVRKMLTMPDVRAVLIHRLIPLAGPEAPEEFSIMEQTSLDATPALCRLMYMASVEAQHLLPPCDDDAPPAPTTTITPTSGGGAQLSSNQGDAYFECQLDGGEWNRCGPTLGPADLAGTNVLRARAYQLTGVQDETPAQLNL